MNDQAREHAACGGDEGSAVVLRDASRDVLVGFYVGSVTQGLTTSRTARGTFSIARDKAVGSVR